MSRVRHIVVVGDPGSFEPPEDGMDVRVVVVENLRQVKQEAHKAPIDGLVFAEKASGERLRDLSRVIDVSKTLIISGAAFRSGGRGEHEVAPRQGEWEENESRTP